MNAVFGVLLLFLAVICAIYSVVMSLRGARRDDNAAVESARNAAVATFPLLTLASLVLIALLVQMDFNVTYVWKVASTEMPVYLRITALWGSQAGSMLFWSWLMSAFTAAAMLRNWKREHHLMPYVIASSMGTLAFFLLLVSFWENPFTRYWGGPNGDVIPALFGPSPLFTGLTNNFKWLGENAPGLLGVVFDGIVPFAPPAAFTLFTPEDGQGLNPLLRHFGMVIHPPMLYLGFVGFVIPYSFGFAALVRGDTGDSWIHSTRRWSLVAWLFLSLGLILGGRWAYDVLGWGGFWGWDPVENAALLPWLTGTPFLHSVIIQEKRGMLKRWNIILITLTYLLVVLGTFLTRSGVLSSVHSFAQSAIGPLFFVFVAGAFILSIALIISRWDQLRDDNQLENLLSRETIFLVQNLIFVAIAIAVFVGTFWPLVTELAADYFAGVEKSSVGPGYYNAVTGPLWLALLFLMGIAPLVAWHTSSLKRLGRAMIWPVSITALLVVGLIIFGVREPLALAGFGVAILAFTVTALEFHRGAIARVHSHQESYLEALAVMTSRNRRRYGGYMIHFGVIIMAIGIIATYGFQKETQRAVAAGQTITIDKYVLEYTGLERYIATDGRAVTRVRGTLYQDGRKLGELVPRIDNYSSGERATIPATFTTLSGDDVYVLLVDWEQVDLSSATLKIYVNPLINWVWGGGVIFIIGTLVAAWPDFSEERKTVVSGVRTAPAAAK